MTSVLKFGTEGTRRKNESTLRRRFAWEIGNDIHAVVSRSRYPLISYIITQVCSYKTGNEENGNCK